MNKKFSTLVVTCMASALVAGSVQAAKIVQGVRNVTKIETDKLYQLGNAAGDTLLVMVPNGNGYTLKLKPATSITDLNSSLWEISYSYEDGATGPDFTFVNKGTGMPLSVDPKDAMLYDATKQYQLTDGVVEMAGATAAWKWKNSIETISSPFGSTGLISYFKQDSILALVTGAAVNGSYDDSEDIYLVKAHASRTTWEGRHLRLAPLTANAVTLTAKDLNTKLNTEPTGDSFKLTATPELKIGENSTLGNEFTKYTFRAWDIQAAQTDETNFKMYVENANFDVAEGGILLQVIDKDENGDDPYNDIYLMADTAYIDGLSVNNQDFVKFGTDSIKSSVYMGMDYLANVKPGRWAKSFKFNFTYYPTQDSLAIDIVNYYKKNTTASVVNGKVSFWNASVLTNQTDPDDNETHVILNKLTASNELTLGTAPANIKFFLGAGNDGRSSEDNGLYYIMNGDGQYLAVPIDEEGYNQAEWVTVKDNEQNVAHMPAYQWVVLKTNDAAAIKDIVPVTIANREFDDVQGAAQLYWDEEDGATYKYVRSNVANMFESTDSLRFVKITDPTVLGDSLLGYMNKNAKELQVMTYKFNYLHPYSTERFIGKNDNDSLLAVLDNVTPFYLKGQGIADYGYEVTADVAKKIPGLKQLRREAYVPYVKTAEGNLYMDVNAEDQYYLSSTATASQSKFYFKENNHYQPEGAEAAQCYYAMIDLSNLVGTAPNADSTKVGITDDDMSAIIKNQVLHETRTSAFAVVPNNTPLYRRFNTELEGAIEGQEDAAKLLRFKEIYRGEYLMDENNANFQNEGVAYVGIERADRVAENAGLSFMVDTAILNATTSGKIKPQYFIMVNREVVDPVPGEACDAQDHQHMKPDGTPTNDPDSCFHAKPGKAGYEVANYMVSFQDSVTRPAYNADKLYRFGGQEGYTRVGFVKGLHIGDSLYILTNGFEKMAAADLDTADIRANYKETDIEFNIIDLAKERTDVHHNYTWSFRYIDPEAAAALDEESRRFLIESNVDPEEDEDLAIAPNKAAWLKSQNGCLVLSDPTEATFDNAKVIGGDAALIFEIEVGSEDDLATDNETITTSEVTVIAGAGQITINGAAGKQVVVSNILGQVVANTVLTSDNATIAAPQGVVVVAVEGEEAVKAIVK